MEESDLSKVNFRSIYSWKAHNGTVSDILYFPERNLVVSSSYDDTVKVWELLKGRAESTHVFNDFDGIDVNCLLRWDEKSFLCATDGGKVFHYSLDPPNELIREFDIMPDFHLLTQKVIGNDSKVNIFDMTKMSTNPLEEYMRRNHINQSSGDQLFAFAGKYIRHGVCGVINYTTNKVIRIFPNLDITIVSFSKILQSFTYPSSIFINSGKEFIRDNQHDRKIHLINLETGELFKEYDKHKANIYSIYNIMKQNREILVVGGSGEFTHFYDVESTNMVMNIKTFNHGCSFVRLGKNNFLVGLGESTIEVIDFSSLNIKIENNNNLEKPSLYNINDWTDDELKNKLEGKNYHCKFRIAKTRTDLDCMCLVTADPLSTNDVIVGEEDKNMIKVVVGSNDEHLYYVGISNLQISPIDDFYEFQQMKRDLNERIEYILFDETRYVGEGEETTIRIDLPGNNRVLLIKHEILKYFIFLAL